MVWVRRAGWKFRRRRPDQVAAGSKKGRNGDLETFAKATGMKPLVSIIK
jgi:hypothetical protein